MYIITISLIFIFIGWEVYQFLKTKILINRYQNIFPGSIRDSVSLNENLQIENSHDSESFDNIVSTLNRYLDENSEQVSDYHLMKDVVERNREVSESEIETLIPFTQYIGLVGTMIGIFIGVSVLVFGGGVESLMSGSSTALADSGVTDLLGGVALAVISSAVGLGLTMRASYLFKEAKREVELRENNFLSWIQSELLPNLSTDFTSTLVKMTNNLSDFNDTFSTNTKKLDKTLSKVNDSYLGQAKLLEELERIDITNIAAANVKVYRNLKNCTEEIGMLAASLKDARLYVEAVRELTTRLGEADERAKTWERMGQFFEKEINEIEKRKAFISEAVGNVDEKLESSFTQLGQLSKDKVDKMAEKIVDQNEKLDKAMTLQQNLLDEKLREMSDAIEERNRRLAETFNMLDQIVKTLPEQMRQSSSELANLSKIKQGIDDLQRTVEENAGSSVITDTGTFVTPPKQKYPKTVKLAIYLIAFYCLIQIIKELVLTIIKILGS